MLLKCCAACPPSCSPRRATAHRSVRFVSILVSAFCPPYDSALSSWGGQSDLSAEAPGRRRKRARVLYGGHGATRLCPPYAAHPHAGSSLIVPRKISASNSSPSRRHPWRFGDVSAPERELASLR